MKALTRVAQAVPSHHRSRHLPLEILMLTVIAVMVSLVGSVWLAPTTHAATCSPMHCYGAEQWYGTNIGASATFKTVGLYSVNDGVNHISEEAGQ